jgi:[1-hydroxy-2-(trimethylamino)ethyl]phosphonate dioxygenase
MNVADITARIEQAFLLLETQGRAQYGMEAVSQLQHALQCARLAEQAGAGEALILAALFHDIGHLTDPEFEAAAARGEDRWHENLGARYLETLFPPEVTEPVRLHVPAKRYLCATDRGYFATLSPASVNSLALQGGPFNEQEAEAFIAQPLAEAAVQVRRWDDLAKDPSTKTPDLHHFYQYVAPVLAAHWSSKSPLQAEVG